MALRLTGTTLQSSSPASTPGASALSSEALVAQARAMLPRGDVDGFAGLFGQADTLAEPQRQFHARLALIDAGVRATREVSEAQATRIFVAIADATLTMLEREPAEPLMLNLAGVACYELWSLDAAQALFKAARGLDPALRDAERNLVEVARRKRGGRHTKPLHAAVPALARRAQSVAQRARPATGLTISLCMIVRDEEEMLPRCLAAAAPAVDEIVIVDTGSKDATIEIARSFGARVIEHEWTGSFSEARNVSLQAATGDWLIYLDADEILAVEDAPRLRELTGQTWREAFYLVETSYTGEVGDGTAVANNALRVFRNRAEYRFKDRLHEQIAHTLPTYVPGRVAQTAVRVTHYGYLGSVREAKEKSQRNVELLRRQAAESTPTPFLHFNLGSEYAAAGDVAAAVEELQRAKAMLAGDGSLLTCEYAPALFGRLVLVQRMCGRLDDARRTATEALELFPDLTDMVLAQARVAQALGQLDEAVSLYDRCLEMGDAPARYGAMVGGGTFLPRLARAELELERGDAGAARTALEWCVEHHPDFLAVAGPYATALLRDGVAPDAVVVELARLDSLPAMVRIAVAGVLRQAGAASTAAEQFRLALEAAPKNTRARVALAELELTRGEWAAAAEQAHLVPADDAHAALACRLELCGLIGRAGPDRVAPALGRAQQAGVPAAERQVFEAWAAIAAGGEAPEGLPVAGAPLLGVLLEMLLRGADGARFVALLPALQRSQLPRRDQQELLAEMYLAHGLLAQAAQEWMAACSPAPDARGLIGLARVAERHGMLEDAANFIAGALELDPQSAAARAVAGRLPVPASA
ncbi:MAG TPA: glycosyltransferase [Solirubrobacteraceae bacterium]|nr:glycosyltransferase [Solirubrobacteraceae bacterium]